MLPIITTTIMHEFTATRFNSTISQKWVKMQNYEIMNEIYPSYL